MQKTETGNAVAAPDFRNAIADATTFSRLIERRLALKAVIAEAEAELKTVIDPAITEMMTEANTVSTFYGDHQVTLVESRRSNLSKEKLIEHGVPALWLEECSVTSVYSYLKVS